MSACVFSISSAPPSCVHPGFQVVFISFCLKDFFLLLYSAGPLVMSSSQPLNIWGAIYFAFIFGEYFPDRSCAKVLPAPRPPATPLLALRRCCFTVLCFPLLPMKHLWILTVVLYIKCLSFGVFFFPNWWTNRRPPWVLVAARGLSPVVAPGSLAVVASLAEHRLWGVRALERRLSRRGA